MTDQPNPESTMISDATIIDVTGHAKIAVRPSVFCISLELAATDTLADKAFSKLNQKVQAFNKVVGDIKLAERVVVGDVNLVRREVRVSKRTKNKRVTVSERSPKNQEIKVEKERFKIRRFFNASVSYKINCPCELPVMSKALAAVGRLGRDVQFVTSFKPAEDQISSKELFKRAADDALKQAQGIAEAVGMRVKRLVRAGDPIRDLQRSLGEYRRRTITLAAGDSDDTNFDLIGEAGDKIVTQAVHVHCLFELEQ